MIDVVHIGLGKCMSTSLQHAWSKDARFNLINSSDVCHTVEFEQTEFPIQNDRLEAIRSTLLNRVNETQINIFSNEQITWPLSFKPGVVDKIHSIQEEYPRIFRGIAKTALLIVRSPVQWLRSCHAQHINEGGYLDLNDFIEYYEQNLIAHTDIRRIVNNWVEQDIEVAVIPLELVKQSYEDFESIFSTDTKTPLPPLAIQHLNKSNYSNLDEHRRVNRMILTLKEEALKGCFDSERKLLNEAFDVVRVLGTRRVYQSQQVGNTSTNETLHLRLKPEIKQHLMNNFVNVFTNIQGFEEFANRWVYELEGIAEV